MTYLGMVSVVRSGVRVQFMKLTLKEMFLKGCHKGIESDMLDKLLVTILWLTESRLCKQRVVLYRIFVYKLKV